MDLISTSVLKLKNIGTPIGDLESELQVKKVEMQLLQKKMEEYEEIVK